MSATYVVVAIKNGAELEICEAYAGANAALGRAFSLSQLRSFMNKEKLIPVPDEVKSNDGTIRWVFINSDKTYVAVHFQNILIYPNAFEPLKNSDHPDPVSVVSVTPITLNQAVMDPVVTWDDPYNFDLPGGWYIGGKPANMQDLWEEPHKIKSVYDLSKVQKWALAKARISKRPNYHLDIPGLGIFDQTRALHHINACDTFGEEVMEDELAWLEEVRNDRHNFFFEE